MPKGADTLDAPSSYEAARRIVDPGGRLTSAEMSEPIARIEDKYELVPAFLKLRGLVRQHIDSFNHFVNHELRQIIHAKGNEKITCDADPNFYMKYETNEDVGVWN